ncbi:MAG: VOC family protein [Rickettsiales bacterium]|nr:VOC family protein [Rickettsiales bacterium]
MPVSIQGVHHIAIICSDYEQSKNFYHHILGFNIMSEVYRQERDSWKLNLAVDDHVQIELFSFPAPPKRPSYPEACGLRHLAFSVEDIHAAREHMLKHGIQVEPIRIDEITGKEFCFFADPDGLPIELYVI